MIWSKIMTERLETLWKDGVGIGRIGQQLSTEFSCVVTRSAVVGKASREGFPEKYPRPQPQWLKTHADARRDTPRPPPRNRVVELAPEAKLAESDATRCRWLNGQVMTRQGNKLERAAKAAKYRKDLANWKPPADNTPVFSCWAEVPRCPNERVPGKAWCDTHCRVVFTNYGVEAEEPECAKT